MKDFLTKRYGDEKGTALYEKAQKRFEELYSQAPKKSKSQEKVFKNMLLPRVALYRVLLEEGHEKEEALDCMEKYMIETAGDMRKKYEMMDSLPCAWALFKGGFTKIVASSDLWDADIEKGRDEFKVTMKRCFWHDTYEEYGCPEVCRYACECDDITYSGLKHFAYSRTETLGTGGRCCDFKFTKNK